MNLIEEIKHNYKKGDNLTKLLLINCIAFLALWIVEIIGQLFFDSLYSTVLDNISAPTSIFAMLKKPWTIGTFLFFDTSFISLLFNLLILFWMGNIFIDITDEKRLVATYILGGLTGLALATCWTSLSNFPATILGPSAAIMAVMVAAATYAPNYRIYLLFFGEVPLKICTLIIIVLECLPLISVFAGNASPAIATTTISEIGGMAFGFLWAKLFKQGSGFDISLWFLRIMTRIQKERNPKPTFTATKRCQYNEESYVSYEEVKDDDAAQEEIDRILDKISKSGYDSLSQKENETLFKQGKK